ncbi:MAG: shikimate dehydrogenase [Betaproteobacteria bacterium]|nr:shikimate dehydrogenase [Betaproteobacteria bacterium]
MDRYAVIGNPVAHSKSPWIHAEFARATGQRMSYLRIEAPLKGFARTVDAFRASGGRGANVTLPFKREAFAYCASTSVRAGAARAVNTLRLDRDSPWGDNTDGAGLLRDLEANLGVAPRGRRVLLMGAGGAAQGVLEPLAKAGAAAIVVVNRDIAKAQALVARVAGDPGVARLGACGYADLAGESFDMVINATSSGLSDELPPLPAGLFAPQALAYDMMYGRDTPFLAFARDAGVRTADGSGMLVEQAAESFFLWRGVRPATRAVLAALRVG